MFLIWYSLIMIDDYWLSIFLGVSSYLSAMRSKRIPQDVASMLKGNHSRFPTVPLVRPDFWSGDAEHMIVPNKHAEIMEQSPTSAFLVCGNGETLGNFWFPIAHHSSKWLAPNHWNRRLQRCIGASSSILTIWGSTGRRLAWCPASVIFPLSSMPRTNEPCWIVGWWPVLPSVKININYGKWPFVVVFTIEHGDCP